MRAQKSSSARHQNAGDHVRVAVQIFGRRVHHHVGPERQRPGEDRSARWSPPGARPRRGRVRRRAMSRISQVGFAGVSTHTGRPGAAAVRRARGVGVEIERDLPVGGKADHPVAQRPVHVVRRDDARARLQRQQHRRGRGHAGGEQRRSSAAFQLVQQGLGGVVGRAGVARVDAPPGRLPSLGAPEGGRQVDRRHDVAVRHRVAPVPMGGEGWQGELGVVLHDARSLRAGMR